MAYSDRYREQHVELAELATQLVRSAERAQSEEDCAALRSDLSRLAGKLLVHLGMEDDNLYPTLAKHPDAEIRATAEQFSREMGGIAQAFTAYTGKWVGSAIKADPRGFANETRDIVAVLSRRIQSENTRLYPLIDRVSAA
jgi:hypothetical protein